MNKLIFITFIFSSVFHITSCNFLKTYNLEDLTNNYDQNEFKINTLINYFDSIIPNETYLNIEINEIENIDIFHIKHKGIYEDNWDVNINSSKGDSLLSILNWDKNQIEILKLKLNEVNCISISNFRKDIEHQHTIGFQRSLMSKFSYVVYNKPLNKLEIGRFDNCVQIFYRDNVALEYGSGATGSICFPNRFIQ